MVSGTRQIRTNRKGVKSMKDYILQVENLKTYFKLDTGTLKAVDDVTFYLKRNETIGIIGESGCGKSVTAHSILRTVQNPGKVLGGRILYDDGSGPVDLVKMCIRDRYLFLLIYSITNTNISKIQKMFTI